MNHIGGDVRVRQAYGMTELSPIAMVSPFTPPHSHLPIHTSLFTPPPAPRFALPISTPRLVCSGRRSLVSTIRCLGHRGG